jgi:hypothetical protein
MFLLACPRCFSLARQSLRSLCGRLTCWVFHQFPACLNVLARFDADCCDHSNVLVDWILVFLASMIARFLRCFDHWMLGRLDTRSDALPCFDPARSCACSPRHLSLGQSDVLIQCSSIRFCRSLEDLLACFDTCSFTGQLNAPSLRCLLWLVLLACMLLLGYLLRSLVVWMMRCFNPFTAGQNVTLPWMLLLAWLLARFDALSLGCVGCLVARCLPRYFCLDIYSIGHFCSL